MSKLKKLFGAGDRQDDEIMYGAEPKKSSDDQTSSERIDSDPAARDERDYGAAAAVPATEESKATTTETSPDKSEDGSESKSKGLLSKILSSKKDKDPEDTTDTTDDRAAETAAVGGATAAGGTAAATTEEEEEDKTPEKSKSKGFLSKILPSKKDKEPETPAESAATTTTTESKAAEPAIAEPSTTAPTTDDSNFGRDATIAGAGAVGAAGVGAAAYEYHERESTPQDSSFQDTTVIDSNPRKDTGDDVSKATYTERSYPLAGGSTSDTTSGAAPTDESHFGRDAAIAGGAAGVVGVGAYAATRSNDEVTPDTTAQEVKNPEQVDTSSRFAPHVPGEFPTEDGRDPHDGSAAPTPAIERTQEGSSGIGTGAAVGTVAAVGAGGAATAAYGRDKDDGYAPVEQGTNYYGRPPASPPASPPATQTEFAEPSEQEHHYGRDAALAGAGAAVVGGGAYAATREDETPAPTSTVTDTTKPTDIQQQRYDGYDEQRAAAPTATAPTTTSETAPPTEEEHHYGRDAAVVGGAGAAGVAATEAWREHEQDTGPAPNTIGPHDSDVKNVMDPRVKPDLSKQKKEPETSGPHQTDIANMLDPRMEDSTPTDTKNEEEQRPDYGRDGAVIAATTAMASAGEDSPKDNRVSTDDRGHHHLHKKGEERTGEKKPGFISKLLHRDKNNEKENDEPTGEGRHFAGASAAQEIEDQKTAEPATSLPVGDDGMIHIVREGSHPDDPHMVIAGDGREVFKNEE